MDVGLGCWVRIVVVATQAVVAVGGCVVAGGFVVGVHGACVGHVSPEAAEGGLIGLLKNGDEITIDIPARSINANLTKAEIQRRAKAAKPWKPRIKDGWLSRYQHFVGNASSGASLRQS